MASKLIKAQPFRDLVHSQHLVASQKFLEKLDYEVEELIKNACLCCFCGAKEYNSTLGILHKRECAIIKLRKDIAEAKSQTN